MKYFYEDDAARKGYLPIDQDRNLISFRLVQCPRCGERRSDSVHVSPMPPAKIGSRKLQRAWCKLARDKSDDAFDRWPLYEQFATLLKQEFPGMYVSASMKFGIVDMEVDELVDLAAPGLGIVVLKEAAFRRLSKTGIKINAWPVKARYTRAVKHAIPKP